MQSKLPYNTDATYTFNESKHYVTRCHFEDTNDGRGATLFGMMILVVVTGVFWFAAGFAIGRMS